MSEAAKKLATNLRGKTFSGRNGEVEEVIDAAVAPLVEILQVISDVTPSNDDLDALAADNGQPRKYPFALTDHTIRRMRKALEQWRTGR
jgi:hypothetical protein